MQFAKKLSAIKYVDKTRRTKYNIFDILRMGCREHFRYAFLAFTVVLYLVWLTYILIVYHLTTINNNNQNKTYLNHKNYKFYPANGVELINMTTVSLDWVHFILH